MERIARQKGVCELANICNGGKKTSQVKSPHEENTTGEHCIGTNCEFLRWITISIQK